MMFFVETDYGSAWKSINNISEYLYETCNHITKYDAKEIKGWATKARKNDVYENDMLNIRVKAGIENLLNK